MHANAYEVVRGTAPAMRPPQKVQVTDGARRLVISQPGGYTGPWSADETPYMVEPMNMLASRRHEAVCFVGPARSGKALDVDTPIPTPTGWTTMGALKVGDEVLDERGRPTRVVFVTDYQHNRDCYAVRFSDGEEIIADAEHRWGVERFYWRKPNWRYEVRTTEELIRDLLLQDRGNGRVRYRYRVRNADPLNLPEADLPIDPYLLGVWLGDGCKGQASISTHKDDAPHYVARFRAAGHKVAVKRDGQNTVFLVIDLRKRLTTHCQRGHVFAEVGQASNGGCMECLRLGHWRRKYGKDRHGNPVPPLSMFACTFSSRLHQLGVHGRKHIPDVYLRASVEQRMQLLQGLMDTDGWANHRSSRTEFTTVLPRLRDDFVELARSLGLKPTVALKKTKWDYNGVSRTGRAYRISFPVPAGFQLFSLPRKAKAFRHASADVGYRQIVSITTVPTRPVKCIQVDSPQHLYLAGRGMVPTHNTMGLLDAWVAHVVTSDPGDMLIVQMTQDKARDFSKTRIDRAIRHSPELAALMSRHGHDDNTHDKVFRNGMWLKIGWPTATQLASSDYRYVAMTDYDRMPDDIDGEGAPYQLGLKRTTTFLSRGMCMVESSPGRPITDPNWTPATPHEAPPCGGILSIYNRSDRRRLYWPCPECGEYFQAQPGLGNFSLLPPESDLLDIVRTADLQALAQEWAVVGCPHCGALIAPEKKTAMNHQNAWLADGETIDNQGRRSGEAMRSTIAGYWLGGVAATYQNWASIIGRHLQGLRDYALTGSELSLQGTTNTDQAAPYLSRLLQRNQMAGTKGIQTEDFERYIVPSEARFVLATVDVQGGQDARFVVQVHAHGPEHEQWLIDRFDIRLSDREGVDGGQAPIDPAGYLEDWEAITERCLRATYRTAVAGRELRPRGVFVDSGGEDGVTENAYNWWRGLPPELKARAFVLKGASGRNAPLYKRSMVGGERPSTGDVPLYLLNVNLLKDAVSTVLRRTEAGPGRLHLPDWLTAPFFDELHAESRMPNGGWQKNRRHNEAFDLCAYQRAGAVILGADRINWKHPPAWAKPIESNSDAMTKDERRDMKGQVATSKASGFQRSTFWR